MTIEAPTEDRSRSAPRDVRMAEVVALGLLAVEAIVILGFLAAGVANQVQYGGQNFSVEGAHAWGYTLSLASNWSAPGAVAVFLLAPLALVAWMGRREGDEISEDRTRVVLRLELVLALLIVVGGILAIVGRVMQFSPPQEWGAFFEILGSGLGSVVLGILGVVVVRWLADDLELDFLGRQESGEDMAEYR